MNTLKKIVSAITILELVMALMIPGVANAAAITSAKDEISTNKIGVAANHTIYFVTPTGVAATNKIVLSMADFSIPVGLSNNDVDIAEGSTGTCSSATFTNQEVNTTAWGVTRNSATMLTITSGTGTITAARCVQIEIGTNAAYNSEAGIDQITNAGTSGSKNIDIGVMTSGDVVIDSTTISVAMVNDPQVDLSASVGTSLTMSLSGTTASLGTLVSGATSTATTTVTINTNSGSGYALKYNASNLTNQIGSLNSLTANATPIVAASFLTTEGWGLNAATVGNAASGDDSTGAAQANYNTGGSYMVVPSTDTFLASASGTASAHAYTVTYGVNIGALTPAGTYSGTVDFIAFGTF
jgi:hypothetical protein